MSEAVATGTEFRPDQRRHRGLPASEIGELTRINPLRATLGLLETVGLLAACIAVSLIWWTPWVVVPALFVIAARQQACFVLAHDAAHYRLFKTRWLNDLFGRAIAVPVGISMCTYRVIHRLHHNHLYEARDPDIPLAAGYPRGRAYLFKKLARDFAGLTAPKTYAYFFGAPSINDDAEGAGRPLDDTSPALRRAARQDRWLVAGFHLAAPVGAYLTGYLVEYLLLWILPMVTILQAILRFRAILEHGAVTDTSSPLTAARTNLVPWWLGWYLFPHSVNYHVEHHMYPSIPHYNLAACHEAMRRHGLVEQAEVRGVFETIAMVVADPIEKSARVSA